MKMKYACGLLAVLLLSAALVPSSVQAGSHALEWRKIDKPGMTGNIVVSPSEVSEITAGRDGVLYAIDSENSRVYRSLNNGVTWEDIADNLIDAGAGLPAVKVAVAPDEPDFVALVTNGGTAVYLSTDGGTDWTDTRVPSLEGTIQVIAISKEYTQEGDDYREIAIGTATWGDSATTGQVWVRQFGDTWESWQNQNLTIDPAHIGGEVSALAYSPGYRKDKTILVVASTSGNVDAAYQDKTWLCIGERDTTAGTTSWNELSGYPVEVATISSPSAGDASGVSQIVSSLALPSDYSSKQPSSRQVFVSYDRETDASDDVYLLDDTTPRRLNADGGNTINLCSIAYYGTVTSGKLLAGDVSPVASSPTVQVRRTSNPFAPSPTWNLSTVPPLGPGNAKVSWSPDGKLAYCGTSQSPGAALDESAFSGSLDGDKWRQLSLMDTVIRLFDIAPAPDSKSLFAATCSSFGPESIWRSASDPLGRHWVRLLAMDTSTDAVILRLSPNYSDDYTIYAAEVGGNQMAVSHNRGNSWQWRHAPGLVIDMVVEDKDTLYVALPDGYIRKSTNGARTWQDPVETSLSTINMLAVAGDETILVGGRDGDVAYSTDGGFNFTAIPEVIGSTGDVQVVADVNYEENGIIYAATNLPDDGIWRWAIGISTKWKQLDKSITALEEGQRISGLVMGFEETLYALRLEPATSISGGMTRSLNPSASAPVEVEFDLVNYSLPEGATFDPIAVFPNTLPHLKLSGDSEQNKLWAVDTANWIIYRFQDTLCKVGPILETPEAIAIIPVASSGYVRNLPLGWEELSGTTTYQAAIYLDSDGGQKVWSGTSTTTGIIATGGASPATLISGTTYYWRVRSTEPILSPWSEIRSFAPALGCTQWSLLTTPGTVTPSPGATNVSIMPAFTWNSAAGATGYEFVLARDSEFTDVVVAMTGADALPTTVWGCDRYLDYATTYFWKVRAISATSYSEWGTGVFTTKAAPTTPLPPQSPPLPSSPLEPTPSIPSYLLWVVIGIGVTLVVALLVLTVRRGR